MKLSNRSSATVARVFILPGVVLLALMFMQAAGQEGPMKAPTSTPESIAAGKAVFFEYCAGCHGRRADGRGPQSMNLDPRPQNLRNAPFVAYLTDERMYGSISGGVRGTAMPAFELMITADKRWEAIHYIRSLTAGDQLPIPNGIMSVRVPADAVNPLADTAAAEAQGKGVWLAYCASCHGARGDGFGRLAESLAPRPRNLVAVVSWGERPFIDYLAESRLFDSISNGVPGTSMQPWVGVLTEVERWSVISYLRACGRAEREKTEQH